MALFSLELLWDLFFFELKHLWKRLSENFRNFSCFINIYFSLANLYFNCFHSSLSEKGSSPSPVTLLVPNKQWPVKEVYEEEDSEETEEDCENIDDGWMYGENNEDDEEETEYED